MMRRSPRPGAAMRATVLAAAMMLAPAAQASSFGVSPIRAEFGPSVKTAAITVSNDDAVPLSFQMRLFAWTQDAAGNDVYQLSTDLIYFPQIMTLAPGEKRLIRIGTKGEVGETERAYRLFIEELPPPADTPRTGTQVAVRLRFGVPLFVAGDQAAPAPLIRDAVLRGGELAVRVGNPGARHVKFESIGAHAAGVSLGESVAGYVLAGAERTFRLGLDPTRCAKSAKLEFALAGDGAKLRREMDVAPPMCRP